MRRIYPIFQPDVLHAGGVGGPGPSTHPAGEIAGRAALRKLTETGGNEI